ncbi:hypothetical protein DICVIV_08714 [Dictyocaulus viviparus]|uniref:Mitochondrial fission factor n=1 Tax=Dictyocaulus viviparus TaxID=29172 RepID=A0A0D8XL57_DICVI|nr:hypothetical protein DICVIV_08714 [Dictyocaulus viviparus]
MIVPEHISVRGEPLENVGIDDQNVSAHDRLSKIMNVPDRIVLTGNNTYKGFVADPPELMHNSVAGKYESNIQDLPSTITLENNPYLDRSEPADEPVQSENSIAVEENPLQELKLMRRQIGRISTRLFQLEDDLEKHRFREKG